MNIRTGSQAELECEERLEILRIKSTERLRKLELKHEHKIERRENLIGFITRSDVTMAMTFIFGYSAFIVIGILIWLIYVTITSHR